LRPPHLHPFPTRRSSDLSRDPPGLARAFHPIFSREILESAQLLGLGVSFQTPVKARLLLRLPSENAASDLAKSIHDDPQRWLRRSEEHTSELQSRGHLVC